jgi:hypothetical protein
MTSVAEVSVVDSPVVVAEERWGLLGKVAFRFSFCYLMLYMFGNGNVTVFNLLENFPTISGWIAEKLFTPFAWLTQWWGIHWLHLTGIAAVWHHDGSGDTLLNYLLCVSFLVTSVVATVVWSVLDWKRANYVQLYAWLRFLVRLNVGMGMFQYGFYKVFPIQMQPPNMAVLNETVGNMSPMTMLWTLLGLVPFYERVCGAAEVMGGLLILFRPTALLGAIVSAFVMTNVVLYNLVFDVPVKLYAIHLLAMACFVMLPDFKALFVFFCTRRSAKLVGVWVPPVSKKVMVWVEAVFLVAALVSYTKHEGERYRAYTDSVRPAPVIGLWQLDAGSEMPKTIGGVPWHEISIDNLTRGMARSTDGMLWRMYLSYDEKKHTLGMVSRGGSGSVKYVWATPDKDHLVLTTVSGVAGMSPKVMTFHRVETPTSYPLLTRGFHWVSEWGYER